MGRSKDLLDKWEPFPPLVERFGEEGEIFDCVISLWRSCNTLTRREIWRGILEIDMSSCELDQRNFVEAQRLSI